VRWSFGSRLRSRNFLNQLGAFSLLPSASFRWRIATAYVWPYSRFLPGWIRTIVFAGLSAFESSSTQMSWRFPVFSSIRTTGARLRNACDMSVSGAGLVSCSACGVSSPGTFATIMLPGLKPSLRSYGATSICEPSWFVGIAACGRWTPSPVLLLGSFFVKRSLGNGMRQGFSA
jgi:hypothetical protein